MPVSWGQSDAHKHDWSAWSAWGEKDSDCVQTRIRYCKDVINCGNTEEETKTNHSMERHQINGVWVKACHYCSATG